MSRLAFRYRYDSSYFNPKLDRDDFGWLSVSASNGQFEGHGGFWVQWQDVREFGEALAVFPISADAPVIGQWGFNYQEGDDLIIRVGIAPADPRGNLRVSFEIADQDEPRSRVRAWFLTNYPDVETFRAQITALMDHEIGEAVLVGR